MRRRNKRGPVIQGPRQLERRYQAALMRMVKDVEREAREQLIDALPRLYDMRNVRRDRASSWDLEIEQIVTRLTVFGRRAAEKVIGDLREFADGVNKFNRRRFAQAMAGIIGVDFTRGVDGPWLATTMRSWAAENAALIRSIPENMLTDVEGIAQRALRTGADPRETAKDIRKRFGVTESRAKLIGRDQVAKLNGQITQARNQALGITTYEWSTSGDERVRESHRAMNGKLCRWDDATVYSSDGGQTWQSRSSIGGVEQHPGQDYQCRCVSRPIFDDELETAA